MKAPDRLPGGAELQGQKILNYVGAVSGLRPGAMPNGRPGIWRAERNIALMKMTKDQMTSGYLTHELRAPLAAIRFAIEIFMEKNSAIIGKDDRHILSIALRNATKLNLLINDIMELSKIQTGRLRMMPVETDPIKLVRETVEDMLSWVEHAKLNVKITAPEQCPAVFVDQRRTGQSLINLISNAIKFTPTGGLIEVLVETGTGRHEGFVVVSVKDTGCGISPEDMSRVFNYFVQVGAPDKRSEGTGLGLSLARSMAEIQGGNMWVKSVVGQGSTFIFTMPLYTGQPPPETDAVLPPGAQPGNTPGAQQPSAGGSPEVPPSK
ncbi:MAG: hypothetical protein COT18_00180 [Elusimicrobia bacterium CG08_land_8_20_14_0_20_59_10]|nr:MAG: hypothetical protein COT18_00180 [Elusimicrobia bacterium CG08_land_8_20_14_0_20_59_10]